MNILQIGEQIINEIEHVIRLKYNLNYAVIGEGDINSELLIIGEAMGREEENQLRIFVGKSGLLLRSFLSRNFIFSFFIINTMPIRPSNNRTPTYDEIKFFSNFYRRILILKQFKKIIAFGKSAETLLKILNIKYFIKTYHPAYLIYKGYDKQICNKFNSDILKINKKDNMSIIKYKIVRKKFKTE